MIDFRPQPGSPPPPEEAIARRLREEAEHCYRWSNGPGAHYGVHSHPYRKVLYVAHGSITFLPIGQPQVTMGHGDRIEIPPGTPHSALVGAEGVVCWEGRAKPLGGPS